MTRQRTGFVATTVIGLASFAFAPSASAGCWGCGYGPAYTGCGGCGYGGGYVAAQPVVVFPVQPLYYVDQGPSFTVPALSYTAPTVQYAVPGSYPYVGGCGGCGYQPYWR